ncbi:MAG: hypothetical protein HYS38_05840 [Acidobacteria bacterium]|nr:hypothetical protein [Acidobacteriota bacterium]
MSEPAYSLEAWRAMTARRKESAKLEPESSETPAAADESSFEVAPCGSPHCGGCYEVAPGARLHPPRISPEWRAYLDRCQTEKPTAKGSR